MISASGKIFIILYINEISLIHFDIFVWKACFTGHRPNTYDIQQFRDLQFVGKCKRTIPSTCTALSVSSLKWSLHGHHKYYFTIQATNLAGLSIRKTSVSYSHNVQLPTKGVVFDVPAINSGSTQAKVDHDSDVTFMFFLYFRYAALIK